LLFTCLGADSAASQILENGNKITCSDHVLGCSRKQNSYGSSFSNADFPVFVQVADNQNSLTVGNIHQMENHLPHNVSFVSGTFGPILLQDGHLIDKLAHFDRERIPERVVHAKGAGAHGYFEVTHDVTKYTKAKCALLATLKSNSHVRLF